MTAYGTRLILIVVTMIVFHNLSCTCKEFRIYRESSGYNCFWRGESPLCFLSSSCPWEMTTMKTDKHGDGAYCWIGFKTYCCIYPDRKQQNLTM
ncbi:unnamed protein product [Rotaria sordida]|uniref:Uncharacterized protein n=1 Tax=Rotaria sordida TaxID=392033 RepID=A0A815TXM0_9BILA|nr:unnamed protein product [Rotaria sordida]CAF1659651.1 unnamed protein product [Rotaria sordida]